MMDGRPTVIFDTSGINHLADDPDGGALAAGLRAAYFIRLTETSISEIVATADSGRRNRLLDVLQTLLPNAHCIYPYEWIVGQLAIGFKRFQNLFDWRRLDVRFPACEAEIARRHVINESLSAKQRQEVRKAAKELTAIYDRVAPTLVAIDSSRTRREHIEGFKCGGGPLWGVGRMLCGDATGTDWTDEEIRRFYDTCPPFRALLLSLSIAEYERCLRGTNEPESFRVGRFDLLMATYLPYCDQFIIADERQLNCLSLVATEAQITTNVRSYQGFRAGLTGAW